ncbi:MAG TPA: YkgJ family cysteine cluster protein [Promineifilum sp.]|nr:YkgJ family cysteine cluster protein [Promineifilum sp.]
MTTFACRSGCGACCIAPSISSPIPGMPHGKPAGVRCVQLTDDNLCRLFGLPDRPAVCVNLRPSAEMCGETREEALLYLERLELLTRPNPLCDNRNRDYLLEQWHEFKGRGS